MTGLLRHRWRALILAAAIAGPLLPVGAAARPAAEATVPTSPGHITIFYTEELDGPYSSVSLVGPDGQQESTQITSSGTRLTATVPPLGACHPECIE
jgi:methionine-rich copper-binding protein CopC